MNRLTIYTRYARAKVRAVLKGAKAMLVLIDIDVYKASGDLFAGYTIRQPLGAGGDEFMSTTMADIVKKAERLADRGRPGRRRVDFRVNGKPVGSVNELTKRDVLKLQRFVVDELFDLSKHSKDNDD